MVVEPRQQLHGDVLEGQRRAVEQLQQEAAGRELLQRRDRGVAEAGVGVGAHLGQRCGIDAVAGEAADDVGGDLGVGPAGEGGDLGRAQLRPVLRHDRGRRRAPGPPAPRRGSDTAGAWPRVETYLIASGDTCARAWPHRRERHAGKAEPGRRIAADVLRDCRPASG